MKAKNVAILTLDNDLHGILVHNALLRRGDIVSHLIAVDRVCNDLILTWSTAAGDLRESSILSNDGDRVLPEDLDLVWWRRSNPPQIVPSDVVDPDYIALIRNDCSAALLGLFTTEFTGRWISDPDASRRAENKLVQLRAAQSAGFIVPKTLVSNDPHAVRAFCKAVNYQAIVKPIRGTTRCHLLTRSLVDEHLESDDCLRLSPAIYQELIPGARHLRVHCFGDAAYAIAIESNELDWRQDLDVPFEPVSLSADLEQRLRSLLQSLGLRMGIVDLKVTPAGAPVWLEINPQGQFLFSEALSGFDLTTEMATFLALEAQQARPDGGKH